MYVAHPFRIDASGRTARADEADHVRQVVEQVLFTTPGERVNRPDFGTGLAALTFEPNGEELRTALEYLVQSGLQRWLSDLVQVQDVSVTHLEGTLEVNVTYVTLRTADRSQVTLRSPAGAP